MTWINDMEMERIIERKGMETTQERRKGLSKSTRD